MFIPTSSIWEHPVRNPMKSKNIGGTLYAIFTCLLVLSAHYLKILSLTMCFKMSVRSSCLHGASMKIKHFIIQQKNKYIIRRYG